MKKSEKTRRVVTILTIAVAMAFLLLGCGGSAAAPEEPSAVPAADNAAEGEHPAESGAEHPAEGAEHPAAGAEHPAEHPAE